MDEMTEANGRLRLGRKRMVAIVLICLAPFFVVLVRSRPFFEERPLFVFFKRFIAVVMVNEIQV